MCGRTAIETGKIAIVAFACFACVAVAFADSLDLAGVDKTVADVSELSAYDGVTNTSETQATLTFNVESDMSYAGTIAGNIRLVKKGTGMLDLSGSSTYTGGTEIDQGRLVASSLTAFGDTSGAITVNCDCQQTSMASNKVTCVVFNYAGDFAYPINTSVWSTPEKGPSGEGGQRQYNVAVLVAGVTLSGKITGGGLSVHFGGLDWNANAAQVSGTTTISGEIDCSSGTCCFSSRGATFNITGKLTALGIYQTLSGAWPAEWSLGNSENKIGEIDIGGGTTSGNRGLTANDKNALGGSTFYGRGSYLTRSHHLILNADQEIESICMGPETTYEGGSLASSDGRHYVEAKAACTVTMKGTADRTNDWLFKDNGTSKAMSLVWAPTGDYTYTCVGHTNTINGTIAVSNGTFTVGDSCSFPNVTAVTVADNASFLCTTEEEKALAAVTSVTLGTGCTLSLPADPFNASPVIEAGTNTTINLAGDVTVESLKAGNRYFSAKSFTAGKYRGITITGSGTLYVSTKPGDEGTYTWVGGGSDDYLTTEGNWKDSEMPDFDAESPFVVFESGTSAVATQDVSLSGITLDGPTAFVFSAEDGCVVSLGSGGISNAPAASASTFTVSAPVMPIVDQVWQMDTNVTFTLSGVLRQYGTATPTITVRPGSVADPVVTINGATTSEAASDFAGNIVFARFAADNNVYWTQHIRASGYEPFGSTGTLTIEGNAQNKTEMFGRHPALYLDNATISKDVSVVNARYAIDIAAVPNTTNTLNGALTFSDYAPRFWAASNSVVAVKGDLNLIKEGSGGNTRFRISGPIDGSPYDGSGRIVFDGKVASSSSTALDGRIMRIEAAVTVELNAQSNRFETIYVSSKDANVICGTKDAVFDGNMIWRPYGHATGSYPCSLDLAGHDQNMGCLTAGNKSAKIKSSDASATLGVNQTNEVSFLGTIATNVTLKMVGSGVLTFSHASAFEAGSTLAVSNGTVVLENATALNRDVDLKLLGGTISVPSGTIADVGYAWYLDGDGNLKELCTGYYSSSAPLVGSYFASGSGSIHVTKGRPGGMLIIFR